MWVSLVAVVLFVMSHSVLCDVILHDVTLYCIVVLSVIIGISISTSIRTSIAKHGTVCLWYDTVWFSTA